MINLNLPKCLAGCTDVKYYELDCEQYKQYLSGNCYLNIPQLQKGCSACLKVKILSTRCVSDEYVLCHADQLNHPEVLCEKLDLGCLPVEDCVLYFKKSIKIKILLLYKCKWYLADCLVCPEEDEICIS